MRRDNYQVLEAESLIDLQDMVSNAIADGKIPIGGIAAVHVPDTATTAPLTSYLQAVCPPSVIMKPMAKIARDLRSECSKSKTNAPSRSARE